MADKVMIHVEQLTKDYGSGRSAVDGISFDVRAGEVLGFLGPNGAGKTTTMKILTSFLAPTSGPRRGRRARRLRRQPRGAQPHRLPARRHAALQRHDGARVPRVRLRRARRAQETRAARGCKRVVEQCGIGDRLGSLIGELSKGYRQRVGLAQAIVHEPEVLILDEPTSGLDPNQIAEIRSVIKSIGQEKTVIFSTHILGEVQATCSRVIIISDGKLVADGTPDELARKSSGAESILLEIGGARGNDTDPLALLRHIDGIEEVKAINTSGWSLSDRPRATQFRIVAKAGVDPRGDIARVIATADGHGPSADDAGEGQPRRRLPQADDDTGSLTVRNTMAIAKREFRSLLQLAHPVHPGDGLHRHRRRTSSSRQLFLGAAGRHAPLLRDHAAALLLHHAVRDHAPRRRGAARRHARAAA